MFYSGYNYHILNMIIFTEIASCFEYAAVFKVYFWIRTCSIYELLLHDYASSRFHFQIKYTTEFFELYKSYFIGNIYTLECYWICL